MKNDGKTPRRLYKYRSFSTRTLDALISDQLFFADPSTFNDPLDTRPSLTTDLTVEELVQIFEQLAAQRLSAEMSAAAKSINYRGPKTFDHIESHSRRRVEKMIADIRYSATDPAYDIDDAAQLLFGQYIENELLRRYDKGIFSLAERANCPLMWSHYGDQHNGLCIGYSVPDGATENLHKVLYCGGRLISASTVAAMLRGNEEARRSVDEAVLTRKAGSWRYEREWRLMGPRGVQFSPLELEEVVFGMRCTHAVKYSIVKALEDRGRAVRFSEIREQPGQFLLRKKLVNIDELTASPPRRALDVHDFF